MNEHEQYMADFMAVFETLERWGPGSEADTLKAYAHLPTRPSTLLEIGCGNGISTTLLANQGDAVITAVDNEESALERLTATLHSQVLTDRVKPVCASMTDLPFDNESFDVIWAEGSAYIMGVTKALAEWKPLLTNKGVLAVSDLVWLSNKPSEEAAQFWAGEYPDMQSIDTRLQQMESAGYEVIEHFSLSHDSSWGNYWGPLKERLEQVKDELSDTAAFKDINREVEIVEKYLSEFAYHMFILRKSE